MAKTKPIVKQTTKKPRKRTVKPLKTRSNFNMAIWLQGLPLLFLEGVNLLLVITLTSIYALGYATQHFNGLSFWEHLLPFALGVVAWIICLALFILLWIKIRYSISLWFKPLPALFAFLLAMSALGYVSHKGYETMFSQFRALVGGQQQAARTTLAHQVYAAYRRYEITDVQKIIDRATPYQTDIHDAAQSFDLDFDLLLGVAATESSFLPRDSHDGGHGLFQITHVPNFLLEQAKQKLAVKQLSVQDSRHNAYIAAATLKHYLAQMHNDLFLGLLAYNIGPKNGGLQFIMAQYGATDFITMQPYLQQLPRDYPIRVLSYALAFRLWHQQGKLLAYQDGDNASVIQHLGIPGLLAF